MAIAAAYNEQKAARRPLTDDEVIAGLARELKRRRESIEAFRAGGREDRAAREEAEAAVVAEFLPRPLSEEELREMVGDVAPFDIRAPRDAEYPSAIRTQEARAAARAAVEPAYDYTFERGNLVAEEQASALRAELFRVLDATERPELRDTVVAEARAGLAVRFDPALSAAQRDLGAEIPSPLIVPNSSYDPAATEAERVRVEQAVPAQMVQVKQGETIVDAGHRVDAPDLEKMRALGLLVPEPDVVATRIAGWVLLAMLLVGITLAWVWRFRPQYWHRTNALVLLGLILVASGVAIELTGGRSLLPWALPLSAAALLLAILLDAGTATVVAAVVAILVGVVNVSLELTAVTFTASLAGAIAVRRGDRLSYFLWAALAMAVAGDGP